jgi:uncharacterized small protein (DUF1192 family)
MHVDSRPFLGDSFRRWFRSRREHLECAAEIAELRKEIASLKAELARATACTSRQAESPPDPAAQAILGVLTANGGSVRTSARRLGKMTSLGKSKVHSTLQSLVAAGVIEMVAGHHGSLIRVVA